MSWKAERRPRRAVTFLALILTVCLTGCTMPFGGRKLPEGTSDYVITEFYGNDEAMEEYIAKITERALCEGCSKEEDGLHVYATEEQKEKWIKGAKENLDQIAAYKYKGKKAVTFNEDYTQMTITVPEGTGLPVLSSILHVAFYNAEIHQVFNGMEKWGVNFILVNRDTGDEIINVVQPEESFTIDDEMWTREK